MLGSSRTLYSSEFQKYLQFSGKLWYRQVLLKHLLQEGTRKLYFWLLCRDVPQIVLGCQLRISQTLHHDRRNFSKVPPISSMDLVSWCLSCNVQRPVSSWQQFKNESGPLLCRTSATPYNRVNFQWHVLMFIK